MAPLTGIALAINWLITKLNLDYPFVKTTKMTTNFLCCNTYSNLKIANGLGI